MGAMGAKRRTRTESNHSPTLTTVKLTAEFFCWIPTRPKEIHLENLDMINNEGVSRFEG